jgi:hypothetical protein
MFNDLYNSVKVRFGQGSSSMTMGEWMCANTTIKKRPFSFEGYEFQRAIADDMHPDMTVTKCSQVGLTEVQIRKYLGMLTRGDSLAGIFTLPNEKMFKRIYSGRIKPILDGDEIFNPPTTTQPVRKMDQIQIRDSFGYVTGCTEGDATSTSADFLMHDEVDLSPQEILALYQSRLQNSDLQMTQKFSTPTFAGFGIDKSYGMTDQREYLCRCDACNHWQIPRFTPEFIHLNSYPFEVSTFTELTSSQIAMLDLEDAYVRCEQCSRRLDLANADLREWVAVHPGRTTFRGYRVRPFSTSRLRPRYIFGQLAKYQEDSFLRGFFNTVLGEPYTNKDAQIQRADVESCMTGGGGIPEVGDAPVFLGVDIGFQCHITLSIDDPDGVPAFVLFESVSIGGLESRISDLRKVYNIVQGASDRFPYTSEVDALRDITNSCIMPVQYRGTAALAPVKDELGSVTHYSANRTFMLDRIHTFISHRKMVLSGYGTQKETLITHLSDMHRDERPDAEAIWIKNSGNDHYFHSMALSLVSRRICEHMFHRQDVAPAVTPDFMGADWLKPGDNLIGNGPARTARFGVRF